MTPFISHKNVHQRPPPPEREIRAFFVESSKTMGEKKGLPNCVKKLEELP